MIEEAGEPIPVKDEEVCGKVEAVGEQQHSDSGDILSEMKKTRHVMEDMSEQLPGIEEQIQAVVNKRTFWWKVTTVFALAAGSVATWNSWRNETAIHKAEEALHVAEVVRVDLLGAQCDSGNDIRRGLLQTIEIVSGEPLNEQTDPNLQKVIPLFEPYNCTQILRDAREASPILNP